MEKSATIRNVLPRFLSEDDWYAAVDGPLESVEDYRIAMSKLRGRAEKRFAAKLQPALRAYLSANPDFPKHVAQLGAWIDGNLDPAVFDRYKIAPATELPNVRMGGDWIITQATRVDSEYDSYLVIGPHGFGTYSRNSRDSALINPVVKAYTQANPGVSPNDPAQLLPYATTSEQKAAIERIQRAQSRR